MIFSSCRGVSVSRTRFATALFCLGISGAAGLVYQVVWMRYLALFIGHTSYAVVAVLVAFMGGLALGNLVFGYVVDRIQRPLALYGWLEILVALYATFFPNYFRVCEGIFESIGRTMTPGGAGILVLKFFLGLAMILLPTLLMGGTLPVLTRLVTQHLGELRQRVSALYFMNSAGAVIGVIMAEFWLIPSSGLEFTVYAGAVMNFLVGAAAFLVSGVLAGVPSRPAASPARVAPPSGDGPFTRAEYRLAVIGIGLSGFVAMLYEVAWTRLLALALGSSSHAFAVMLMTFITGIALGAWIIGRWQPKWNLMSLFAWAELGIAAALFLSLFTYELLPYWSSELAWLLNRNAQAYPLYRLMQALICFSVMLIPTIFLGTTLPLVSRIATAEVSRTGRSVGLVFAVNTLGTVLGAAVTGLWLMPFLGLAGTFSLGIALNASIGGLILLAGVRPFQKLRWLVIPLFILGLVSFGGKRFGSVWQRALTQSLWRKAVPPRNLQVFRQQAKRGKILYHRDGAGATVTVASFDHPVDSLLSLRVNGKVDASTAQDMVTQLLSGHIPMLLHPNPKRVLVVGLGSGVTCAAVLRHPAVQRLDTVEILPEVVEAARYFHKANDDALDHPKLHLIVEDAKSFLKLGKTPYDVIISEPSNPWIAGVSGVFSLEYYQRCRDRLTPRGLMVQWVQIYETNNDALKTVLATFGSVFPRMSVWMGTNADLILVGSKQPLSPDLAEMERRFYTPEIYQQLSSVSINRFIVFLTAQIVSQANGYALTPDNTPIHSDFSPVLDALAQKGLFQLRFADYMKAYNENLSSRPLTLLASYLKGHPIDRKDLRALASFYLERKVYDPNFFRTIVQRWLAKLPNDDLALAISAQIGDFRSPWEGEAENLGRHLDQLVKEAAQDPDLLRQFAKYTMQTYRSYRSVFFLPDHRGLERALNRLIEVNPKFQRVYRMHLAELAWDRGEDDRFLKLAETAFDPDVSQGGPIDFEFDSKAPYRTLALMIETYWRQGRVSKAWAVCGSALRGGYLGKKARYNDPLLRLAFRKVLHGMDRLQPASLETGQGNPLTNFPR